MVYRVGVRKDFIARHFLTGGDWGRENELHSHPYAVEAVLTGDGLDSHGYLVDIVRIEACLDGILARIADTTLNDLPEFAGLNPSIERLAEVFCGKVTAAVENPLIQAVEVKVFESANAWASCGRELR